MRARTFRLGHYGLAIIGVTVAVIVRWLLDPTFGDRLPFTTYYPAVMLAAYFGGLGPGLLATALSSLTAAYFWLAPEGSTMLARREDWIALALFTFNMAFISLLSENLRRAKERADDNARRVIEQEQRYRTIVENASEGIWIIDADSRTTFVNPQLCEMLGYSASEMIGRTPYEFVFDDDQQAARERIQGRKDGDSRPREFRFRRKDGGEFWATVSTSILHSSRGEFVGLLALLTDATEQRQAQAEREQILVREQEARQLAEAANQQKDEFLAVLSHELRTPLNSVIGWASLLKDRKLDQAGTAQAIDVIFRNAKAQAQIIEDLLDVSRIISGKLTLNQQPVKLEQVIAAALDAVRPMAEAKQVTITTGGQAAGVVMGDPTRLQQVFMNLLTNAFKFTPHGGRISVRLDSDERSSRIIVEDNGDGIRADFLPFIFERFRQADSSYTRKHAGLGLGLAITRHLVELHGGTITATSAGLGQGSAFTVVLPLALAQEVSESSARHEANPTEAVADEKMPLAGIRILIVDDDKDTREVMRALLGLYGAETLAAASAAEALSILREWRPDLLLSDLGMPDEDGYALIRQVRSLPREEGGSTPAAALTGYASEEESARVHQAGFQAHIAKPIEAARLVETVARLTGVNSKRRGA